jgi:hypothetical protein
VVLVGFATLMVAAAARMLREQVPVGGDCALPGGWGEQRYQRPPTPRLDEEVIDATARLREFPYGLHLMHTGRADPPRSPDDTENRRSSSRAPTAAVRTKASRPGVAVGTVFREIPNVLAIVLIDGVSMGGGSLHVGHGGHHPIYFDLNNSVSASSASAATGLDCC